MCGYGVVAQTCLPLHQMCHHRCSWRPSMGVFETHNTKQCVFMAWRHKCIYLCAKYVTSSLFWKTSIGVFEMHNAKKIVLMAWRPKRVDLGTKYTTNIAFGHLVWVCLKCTRPQKCVYSVAPQARISLHQIFYQ